MADTFQYEGAIEKIYFQRQPDFTIGALRTFSSKQLVRFIGPVSHAQIGQAWRLEGIWEEHRTYGRQLQIQRSKPIEKPADNTLEKFFASSTFKGIGPAAARKIVESLGENAVDVILKTPSLLKTKCGLNDTQCENILGPLQMYRSAGFQVSRLLKWGLDQADINLLADLPRQRYGDLDTDPFWPFYHVYGFGFESARKMADGLGLPADDFRRIEAELFRLIVQFSYSTGSTGVPSSFIEKRTGYTISGLEPVLSSLKERGLVIEEDGRLYLLELYQSELTIASGIKDHLFDVEKPDKKEVSRLLDWASHKRSIRYDENQRTAIETFLESSIMILNGGPGTGKSTLLVGLLDVLHQLYPTARTVLCAPTGRAAKRMNEVTGHYASTIHSLLRWDKNFDSFEVNENSPLSCDFVVVDEFSMVDSRLFASLLKALPEECRILLIGDEDQLESVGPGNVMQDLIASRCIPVVRLEKIHRQKEGSGIPQLARQIRTGQKIEFCEPVEFLQPQGETVSCIRSLASLEEDPESIQILAPKYEGASGIYAINSMMQELVNPFSLDKPQLVTHHTTNNGRLEIAYRENDKVLLKKNMAELDIFNGDIGRISQVDPAAKTVMAQFGEAEIEIERKDLSAFLSHAWCISIHKSQGSEYQKACVVADSNGAGMLQKRLLYTAVSRAKKRLTIVGDEKLFRQAALNSRQNRRLTTLCNRIVQLVNHEEGWQQAASAALQTRSRYVKPADPLAPSRPEDELDQCFDTSQTFSLEGEFSTPLPESPNRDPNKQPAMPVMAGQSRPKSPK